MIYWYSSLRNFRKNFRKIEKNLEGTAGEILEKTLELISKITAERIYDGTSGGISEVILGVFFLTCGVTRTTRGISNGILEKTPAEIPVEIPNTWKNPQCSRGIFEETPGWFPDKVHWGVSERTFKEFLEWTFEKK